LQVSEIVPHSALCSTHLANNLWNPITSRMKWTCLPAAVLISQHATSTCKLYAQFHTWATCGPQASSSYSGMAGWLLYAQTPLIMAQTSSWDVPP
jgi:hypothetical protein